MERNADGLTGGSSGGAAGGSTGGFGDSGDVSGTSGYAAGASGSIGTGSSSGTSSSNFGSSSGTGSEAGGVKEKARDMAGTAKEKLADVGSTVREQAGTAKDKLADALESGADKLRQRTARGELAGATGTSGSTDLSTTTDGKMSQVTDRVAGGMQATADWLRDADLDSLRSGVERQVKEHPGRTLLFAVGLGYLLGKAFRK
jgi:hypothetical protein